MPGSSSWLLMLWTWMTSRTSTTSHGSRVPSRARAGHRARESRALSPAHLLDGIRKAHVLGREPLDLHDPVPGLDPGPPGGRALDRRHHGQLVVANRDLDPEAAEAARGLDLH